MAQLSISRAWDEGTRFAAREFRLLYPVALLLLELPTLLVALITPRVDTSGIMDPRILVETIGIGTFILIFVVLGLVVFALQTLGSMTISLLALRPGASVGESLSVSAGRLPALFAAVLLLGVGLLLLMLPVWLLVVGSFAVRPSIEGGIGMLFLFLLFFLFIAAVSTRLVLMTPVGVAERVGPVGIISRSWRLTSGHFWKLFGTFLLIGIVYLILAFAISFVLLLFTRGLIGSPDFNPTAGFVFQLLTALFTAAIAVFFITFVARIYAQLSGRTEEIGEVFT
jgi:hypothetical protein